MTIKDPAGTVAFGVKTVIDMLSELAAHCTGDDSEIKTAIVFRLSVAHIVSKEFRRAVIDKSITDHCSRIAPKTWIISVAQEHLQRLLFAEMLRSDAGSDQNAATRAS